MRRGGKKSLGDLPSMTPDGPTPLIGKKSRLAGRPGVRRVANIRFLRQAQADLEKAVAWYESRSPKAARRFEHEVTTATARIGQMPEIYALVDEQHRLCPIRKSQYLLVYRFAPDTNEVMVIAVAHARQDPDDWHLRG